LRQNKYKFCVICNIISIYKIKKDFTGNEIITILKRKYAKKYIGGWIRPRPGLRVSIFGQNHSKNIFKFYNNTLTYIYLKNLKHNTMCVLYTLSAYYLV